MKMMIKILELSLMALAATFVTGCMEDESFADLPTSGLAFSSDTIDFGCVYAGIGSRTEELTVFNLNSDGVRVTSIRMAGGKESPFRMNVDGMYGDSFSEVEIFGDDSIFVFVDVIPGTQPTDTLMEVKDSIIFTMPNGKIQSVVLRADGQNVTILKGKVVTDSLHLTSERPYIIYDSLVVKEDATLTIDPGVSMCFHKKAELMVFGTVDARGTLEKPIIFRGDRTDNLLPTLPYDNTAKTWGGIHIYSDSKGNIFDFCDIHGGTYGIKVDATTKENSLVLTNSIINNVAGNCLDLTYCDATIGNCQITNGKENCVKVSGGNVEMIHCTIAQFYLWDTCGSALLFTNYQDSLAFPLERLTFSNCIVTGWEDDEVKGSMLKDSDAMFEYNFQSCLLQADTTGMDSTRLRGCVIDSDTTYNKNKNFRNIRKDDYSSDFSLDSLSRARGIARYVSESYLHDLKGIARPRENSDAGCYQYQKD